MTEDLETALRRTLADAADRAPAAPAGLGGPVRRPRSRVRVALLAAAVAVVIAVGTVGGRTLLSGTSPATPATSAPPLHRPKKTKVPPIEKIWPNAVHRVPRTLTDGRTFRPQAFIDDRTLLVSTDSSFERSDDLYAYDLRNHHTTHIVHIAAPPKTYPAGFTAGSGYVAWSIASGGGSEIWAAPLSGGPQHLVTRVKSKGPERLEIEGASVIWSRYAGGVYLAPLSGGPARAVPGGSSMHLLSWPWMSSSFVFEGVGQDVGTGFRDVTNALTGEKRSAHLTDKGPWNCDLTWCVGSNGHFVTEAQRRDGTGRQALPGLNGGLRVTPLLDRFAVVAPEGGTLAVYDLRTGRMGDLRIKNDGSRTSVNVLAGDPSNPLYYTGTAGGYVIVDLSAI